MKKQKLEVVIDDDQNRPLTHTNTHTNTHTIDVNILVFWWEKK